MLIGIEALEKTDWSKLLHAYDRAVDTPDHLRALLQDDAEAHKKAMFHLWGSILHQGTPWTATGPAVLVIAGFLLDDCINRDAPLRFELLEFLAGIAGVDEQAGYPIEELEEMARFDIAPFLESGDDDALYEDEDASTSLFAHSILGCFDTAPVLMKVMSRELEHPAPHIRAVAAKGAAALAKLSFLKFDVKEIHERLLIMAQKADETYERCSYILALGDTGFSPIEFLDDPSPAVRMCASLAPALATNPAAIKELLTYLEKHVDSIDTWFEEGPQLFPMKPRFEVVARLVEQVKEFARLEEAAVAVARFTSKYSVDGDWGPLLKAAFPGGNGKIETDSQRRFLAALVENKKLWDPRFGNAQRWFKEAGLPYDRKACAKMAK